MDLHWWVSDIFSPKTQELQIRGTSAWGGKPEEFGKRALKCCTESPSFPAKVTRENQPAPLPRPAASAGIWAGPTDQSEQSQMARGPQ